MASASSPCPDRERLRALVDGDLDETQEREAAAHVERCSRCQEQLEALAAGQELWSAAARLGRDPPRASGELTFGPMPRPWPRHKLALTRTSNCRNYMRS